MPDTALTHSIGAVLEDWAARLPGRRLFAFLDRRGEIVEEYTYARFVRRVDTLASDLAAAPGLAHGDRVLLAYQPGLELVAALFACAKVGLIAVPTAPLTAFDYAAWAGRIDHVLDDSGAAAWLTCSRTLLHFEQGRHRPLTPEAAAGTQKLLSLPSIDTTAIPTDAAARAIARPHPIAFIQYTSGSTSNPKGVCVSHANLIANCRAAIDHADLVGVSWLPQHHDMGLIGSYIYVALSGGTTYGLSPGSFVQNPALWIELLSRHRATATSVPNFALELCLNERRVPSDTLGRYDLSAMRVLMVAAEPVVPATFDAFRRKFARAGLPPAAPFVAFGLAEFTLAVSSYGRRSVSVDRRRLARGEVVPVTATSGVGHALPLMSCGRALAETDIRIVDPERGLDVPPGRTGEIWVAGPGRAHGYWRNPAQSRTTFEARPADAPPTSEAYLRTGDIGFVLDGELFVCGRLKDMMIVRGQNIYPEDIEALARQAVPELRANGVAAFASDPEREADITLVAEVPRGRDLPDAVALVRAVREGLQVPVARVVFVPPRSVARTSSGKVRRAATRDRLARGELRVLGDTRHAVPAGAAETGEDIHELALLKDRYGLTGAEETTLFDAGIDSLDLVILLGWVKEALEERGAAHLAERVTPRLIAAISVRELFAIARQFDSDPAAAVQAMGAFFADAYAARLARERAQMQADRACRATDRRQPGRPPASWPASRPAPRTARRSAIGTFVTGGTGFLGPYLLDALLAQSDDEVHVLVRGGSAEAARARLERAFFDCIADPARRADFARRVHAVPGDIAAPRLGLPPDAWERLADGVHTVWHNGALVNYLLTYEHMRPTNVAGTAEVLDLCLAGREKVLNAVSTTFVFGWTARDVLWESDRNEAMDGLDFGYSQSKWVGEQKVFSAMEGGLPVRLFRPSLITPALTGGAGNLDITMRLLSFMIRHGLGVTAGNQISLTPADIAAANMVAIAGLPDTVGGTFHVVRDEVETMRAVTDIIAARQGTSFRMLDLPHFVPEVIRRCTRADPLYPLLDFLVGSVDSITAMEAKRYDSRAYRAARDRAPAGRADPPLEAVVDGILRFLSRRGLS